MSNNKVQQQSKVTFVATLFALAFTLSSLPGIKGQSLEEGSSDLLSLARDCGIDGQIKEDGTADCNASVTGNKDVKGKIHIEKVAKTETTEGGYIITGEFEIKCDVCVDGVRNSIIGESEETFASISLALAHAKEVADQLAEDTKKEIATENCKIDADGDELDKRGRLECLIGKMGEMNEDDARKFYDKKIKGELAALAQSSDVQDNMLAAALASQIHQKLGVNCAKTVAAAQHAQMMTAAQPFNPMAAPQLSSTTPTDYITESTCDTMMMANYSARMQSLAMQMKSQNPAFAQAAAKEITALGQQWGNYFAGRGFALNNPIMNQINADAGTLLTSIGDFNKTFTQNYQEIVKRHSDLLGGQQQQQVPGAEVNANNRDLRLLRGGGVAAENSNGGAPSVTPFPQLNGNGNNMGMNIGNQFGGPQMNGLPNGPSTNAPKVLAPMRDTPVGG